MKWKDSIGRVGKSLASNKPTVICPSLPISTCQFSGSQGSGRRGRPDEPAAIGTASAATATKDSRPSEDSLESSSKAEGKADLGQAFFIHGFYVTHFPFWT